MAMEVGTPQQKGKFGCLGEHLPSEQLLGETLNIDEYGQQTPPSDVEPEPLLAGSEEFVDHFRHNAEAYASGNYSCASFRPPRSRSPTPGMKDYHIVVSDDVQPGTDEILNMVIIDTRTKNTEIRSGRTHFTTTMTGEKTVSTLSHTGPDPDAPIETRYFGPEECPKTT